MATVRINDNTFYPEQRFAAIPRLTEKVAGKTLEALEKESVFVFPEALNEALGLEDKQTILERRGDSFRAGNVAGFIGLGSERLVITSRFSGGGTDGGSDGSARGGGEDYFFWYLLSHAMNMPNIVKLETDTDRADHVFNLLIFLFPDFLKSALRKGVFKMYIRRRYNDQNVRGVVDIARHIKENTPFTGSIAYSRREHSYDNYLTELVRHTIEYIRTRPAGRAILARVREEIALINDATLNYKPQDRRGIITENKQHPVRHAYYSEYRRLQELCLMILEHEEHSIGRPDRRIYGVLFDVAWLWEEYVNTLIGGAFFHPRNKAQDGRGGGQWLFRTEDGVEGLVYPDFISRATSPRVIADAKYKRAPGIGGGDYHQILSYMLRFDAARGYFLYPESGAARDTVFRLNSGSSFERNVAPRSDIVVIKRGFPVPSDAASYKDFTRLMKQSEKALRAGLLSARTESA